MTDIVELYTRQIETATLALGRNDRPAAVVALNDAIGTTRGTPALHCEHVDALIRLARIKQELAQPVQAERLLTEALVIGERHFGARHSELVVALNELSRLFIRRSAHARAEPLLNRLLEIHSAKGEDHPDVATVLAALAVARRGLGDHAAAEALYRRALAIREKVLAPGHMAVVITLEQLSETCAARGNFADALALLQRALPTRERALGAEHASVRALCARIADLDLKVSANHRETTALRAPAAVAVAPGESPMPIAAPVAATPLVAATAPVLHVDPAPPKNAYELVFLYEPERPKFRRVTQPRERVTPQFSAAVAAASIIAAPASLAAQPLHAAPTQMTAPSLVAASTYEAFSDSRVSLASSSAPIERTQPGAPRFPFDRTPATATTDRASIGKRITRFVPVAAGVLAIAVATYAAGAYAAKNRDGVKARGIAEPPTVVAVAPPPMTSVATITAAAESAVTRADSMRTASAPLPRVVPLRAQQSAPQESALALPTVSVALPSVTRLAMPNGTSPNVDSVMRASTRIERDSYGDQLAPTAKLRSAAYGEDRSATSPVLVGDTPQPRYPESLRGQRMEGEVVVQFLVDETGRVDASSMKVVRSPHELFTAAVRGVLPKFRFEPARSATSKAIAEQVQYAIRFAAPK
ncbi:MAG: TonB family protein [bacterium]